MNKKIITYKDYKINKCVNAILEAITYQESFQKIYPVSLCVKERSVEYLEKKILANADIKKVKYKLNFFRVKTELSQLNAIMSKRKAKKYNYSKDIVIILYVEK